MARPTVPSAPRLLAVATAYPPHVLHQAEVAKGFPAGVMPQDYSKTLSPQELDALVNYLVKVTSK